VLFVWADRTYGQRLLFEKRPRDVPEGAGMSQDLSPIKLAGAVAAAVHPTAAVIQGVLGNKEVDMMVDSGSSVSLPIEQSVAVGFSTKSKVTESSVRLVSAAGDNIPTLGSITLSVQLGPLRNNHSLVIVDSLISPVILGLENNR